MLEKLQTYLDSPQAELDMQEWLREQADDEQRMQRNTTRVINRIRDISDTELDSLFQRLVIREKRYQDMFYKRGVETESKMFSVVRKVWEMLGDDFESDEMFFCEGYIYRGYVFKTYCGQGCFTALEFKGKRLI